MARPLRLDHPGAIWHITARGIERRSIFADDEDRARFIELLGSAVEVHLWNLHAWVLMGNHYHLLLDTPEANLSQGMRQLGGIYSQRFNHRHDRVGPLFQGRYKAILVERESHLLELARYLVLNPVRAGIVRGARDYRFSSYKETAGLKAPASWLEVDWTLSQFGRRRSDAQRRYRQFVSEGRGAGYDPWKQASGFCLGGEEFRSAAQRLIDASAPSAEVPRAGREILARPTLEDVLTEVESEFGVTREQMQRRHRGEARKAAAMLGRRVATARLREIGGLLGIKDWSVSNLARLGNEQAERDRRFRARVDGVERRLWKARFAARIDS